jgi:hypothetical protein
MAKAEASAIIAQATIIERAVVRSSKRKNNCFMGRFSAKLKNARQPKLFGRHEQTQIT